ncbi:hypothetical protein ALC53_12598, partial [Atta colombica]
VYSSSRDGMLFFSAEAIASERTPLAFSPESRSFAVTRTTDVPAGSFSRDAGKRAETATITSRSWKRREKYESWIGGMSTYQRFGIQADAP